MSNQIFGAALGIVNPWYIKGIDFDADRKNLAIQIDFVSGSRFAHPGADGVHSGHSRKIGLQRQHSLLKSRTVVAANTVCLRSIPCYYSIRILIKYRLNRRGSVL